MDAPYQVPAGPDTFNRVPSSVIAQQVVNAAQLGLYTILLDLAKGAPSVEADQATLAARSGYSEKTVSRHAAALEQVGLVAITRQGQGRPNCYTFTAIPLRSAKDKTAQPERKPIPNQTFQPGASRTEDLSAPSTIDQIEDQTTPPPPVGGGGGESKAVAAGDDPDQVHRDAWRIDKRLRLDPVHCLALARQAYANGRDGRYIRDLLDYVTSTPDIRNPAGCFRKLVEANESRPAPRRRNAARSAGAPGIDSAKYRSGKYAHLFARSDGTGSTGLDLAC